MAMLRPFYPNTKYPSVLEPGTHDEGKSGIGTEELGVFKIRYHHTVTYLQEAKVILRAQRL